MEGTMGNYAVSTCFAYGDSALRMAENGPLDLRGVCNGSWKEAGWTPYGSMVSGGIPGLA